MGDTMTNAADMSDEATDAGSGLGSRGVILDRDGLGRYRVTNERGGTLSIGAAESDFTPVELLLAAIAGCASIDVDHIASKRADALEFRVVSEGEKVRDDSGNHLAGVTVTFSVRFPESDAGDAARAVLPKAIDLSHDRLCTVSRTVQLATPITMKVG